MTLIGKADFKNFGTHEVYIAGRGRMSSPISFYILANGRWISAFERRVRGWPSFPVTFVLLAMYKQLYRDKPVMRIIAENNPMFDELPAYDLPDKSHKMRIRSALPNVWRKLASE